MGQENGNTIKRGNYYFNYPTTTDLENLEFDEKLKENTKKDDILKSIAGSKYRIEVTKVEDGIVYFIFGKFVKDSVTERTINNPNYSFPKQDSIWIKSGKSNHKKSDKVTYLLPLDDFKKNTEILYNRVDWRVGFFTIPYKLRFSDFSFDANVNIGVSLGAKIRCFREKENGIAFEPVLGIGVTGISLNDANSQVLETTNSFAFSINTGLLIHITEHINLGVLYGFDNLSANDQTKYDWRHNGNGWLGLGINVTFSTGKNNTGAKASN